jgi:CRP/FNR family transcriptional regulator, cyclic AMP receptor protein
MTSRAPLRAGDPDAARVALAGHPFCAGLQAEDLARMAEGASERRLDAGDFVIRHGGLADALYLLIDGDVSLEMADPGREPTTVETLHGGDTIGWSWLYPPSTWAFDARCRAATQLWCLDGAHLRQLMETDPRFGHELALRIGRLLAERLHATRAQLLAIQWHDDPAAP